MGYIRGLILALILAIAAYFGYDYWTAKKSEVVAKVAVGASDTTKENTNAVNSIVKKSDEKRTKLTPIVSHNKSISSELQQLTKSGGHTSSEACRAEANKIATYQEVFGECTRVLTEVAEAADEHLIDAETYKAAYAAIK